jgi:hypothetical protein
MDAVWLVCGLVARCHSDVSLQVKGNLTCLALKHHRMGGVVNNLRPISRM